MDAQKITEYIDSLQTRGIPFADCQIMKEHEVVYRHFTGKTDKDKTVPMNGTERYLMFSMTKVQTMTAFMQLVEQGRLSYEDEVFRFLPAYRNLTVEQNGKIVPLSEPLKLWHLVSMQSGLDYDLGRAGIVRVLKEKGDAATTQEIVASFAETPLKFVPGENFLYSLSHDVVAAVIEKVSGMRFGEYLKKNIWDVLGMENTGFAKPMNEGTPRLCTQYICGEGGKIVPMEASCNYQFTSGYESGGAGLMSCMKDYAVLADALACGGVGKDGGRILKPESVERFKKNLLGETSLAFLASSMGRPAYGYGTGMQILLFPEKVGSVAPVGIFGWDGAAGSCVFMDTKEKLSMVYLMHVRNCGFAYSEIHPTLRDLLYS